MLKFIGLCFSGFFEFSDYNVVSSTEDASIDQQKIKKMQIVINKARKAIDNMESEIERDRKVIKWYIRNDKNKYKKESLEKMTKISKLEKEIKILTQRINESEDIIFKIENRSIYEEMDNVTYDVLGGFDKETGADKKTEIEEKRNEIKNGMVILGDQKYQLEESLGYPGFDDVEKYAEDALAKMVQEIEEENLEEELEGVKTGKLLLDLPEIKTPEKATLLEL